MTTEIATSLARGSAAEAAEEIVRSFNQGLQGRPPAFAMVFASTLQPLAELMKALSVKLPGTTLLAASSAGEFTERGDAKSAVSAVAVAGDFQIHAGFGDGLKENPSTAVARALAGQPRFAEGYPHRTALMLIDPLAGRSEEATLLAAMQLGDGVQIVGGAAGDDLKMSATPVALGERVGTNAVVLATVFSRTPWGVGVQHGHRAMSPRMKVTRAAGNVVAEIEGRPAWQVWAEQTRQSGLARGKDPLTLEPQEVGPYLLLHEAGLQTGNQLKIRAPLSKDDQGAISFACGIPEGTEIQITESDPDRQVSSAREAARRARARLGKNEVAGAIVFDCICRNLILGERFNEAVRAIAGELDGAPLAGFETYGEIAFDGGDLSGFHNTTTVVLCLPKE